MCYNHYTPVPNKAAQHSTRLNAMSSTCFKDKTPTNVTTDDMDESSESDNFSDSNHEMDDTSSVEDQKVTAVVAVIDTSTEDPASGIEHSRCCRTNKLLFTKKIRVLLDSGSDGDIWFHKKGATKRFPYTERQTAKSYHTSAGVSIHQMDRPSLK
jgi:hypothetical protein